MNDLLETVEQAQAIAAFAGMVLMLLWESAHPFFDLFRESKKARGMHLLRNLVLGGLNALLISIVFVGLWIATAAWAELHNFGLLNAWGTPLWLHAFGAVLLMDGWTYLWHRMNHRLPFLWRFHRVHHADAKMDVTTASRFHTGEILFSSLLRIPLIALFGIHVWELLLYETMMFAVVQFHHANIVLPDRLDRVLRLFIVTPAMHKVHHSRWQPETDSNYSSFLSFWDRMGRSFKMREHLADIQLGLNEFDADEHTTVGGLLKMPLASVKRPDVPEETDR